MNREMAQKVANAVLYEGYMLYPYRPSAIKNRQRWSFGILYPPGYAEVKGGTERSQLHTECLLECAGEASVNIVLRFLQLMNDGVDEIVERSVELEVPITREPRALDFDFPRRAGRESLACHELDAMSQTQHTMHGKLLAVMEELRNRVWKLKIDVINDSSVSASPSDRNAALLSSLLSAHLILTAKCADFTSLLDPPAHLMRESSACVNVGNFPVLVGAEGERDMLLCSPILLYDYPQVAPESAGDFYDATEMDEMLTLRVMTLTDEEKAEMRHADDRVRAILQRTEKTAREQLARTHGVMRNLRPANPK